MDVGPETLDLFARGIALCNTIVFNGPMGVFEMEPFALRTNTVARLLAEAMDRGATTIVGGGGQRHGRESGGAGGQGESHQHGGWGVAGASGGEGIAGSGGAFGGMRYGGSSRGGGRGRG